MLTSHPAMASQEEILRRRERFGFAALLVLLLIGFFAALTHLPSVPYFFSLLHPFTVMEAFLLQWYDWAWVVTLLLVLIPLLGWLLLRRKLQIGRFLIIASQCVILTADAFITPLHLFNDMGFFNWFGGRAPSSLGTIALLGLTGAVYPIAVLVLTNKWKPHIKE